MSRGSPEGGFLSSRTHHHAATDNPHTISSTGIRISCKRWLLEIESQCLLRRLHSSLILPVWGILQTELGDLASYDGEHHRAHAQLQEPANYAKIESGLTFLGLAGLMDPPRPEVSIEYSCTVMAAFSNDSMFERIRSQ